MSSSGAARVVQRLDADTARGFLERSLAGTVYLNRALELLEQALGGNPESRALISADPANAIAFFEPVAGAQDTWQVRLMCVATELQRDAGRPFMESLIGAMRGEGARVVVAELPADEAIGGAITLLRANGFRQTGRIADYYRDGVALLFLRREL